MGKSPADAPTLSVILPNYNHGYLIGRAIDALLSQERPPDEIIVVDDASTDDSLATIQLIAAKSPRIVVVTQPVNSGTVLANRRGLERARSEYIYFAAADDWVMPGFFALALRMLADDRSVGLFCGDATLIDGATGRTIGDRPAARPAYRAGLITPAQTRHLLARMDNWILTGSSMFLRDAIVAAGGLDEKLGAFADGFIARKIALTTGFYYAPRIVAAWCIFASGVSRTTASDVAKAQSALQLFPAKIASDAAFPDWYAGLFGKRWRFSTARLALQQDPIDYAFISSMAATSDIDQLAFKVIRKILKGRIQRATMLGWLWLRLRPYRLTDLVATALSRRLERLSSNSRSGASA
jgi:glycosyltransferase involved in cell wall biosynthesis